MCAIVNKVEHRQNSAIQLDFYLKLSLQINLLVLIHGRQIDVLIILMSTNRYNSHREQVPTKTCFRIKI